MGRETILANVARTRFSRLANLRPEQADRSFVEVLFNQCVQSPQQNQAVLDAVHEPLLVLDGNFKILFANASFRHLFQAAPGGTEGRKLFSLNGAAWKSSGLQSLLEATQAGHSAAEGFEVSLDFSWVGPRIFLLRATKPIPESGDAGIIFLSFSDVTAQRALEQEVAILRSKSALLLQQKDILLAEIQHRFINSLQIIASILMLKARSMVSDETRRHLHDAHRRVLSVAAVQQHLRAAGRTDMIEVASYLSKLCGSLAESMTDDSHHAVIKVEAGGGTMTSPDVVSLGLIVTELVINAFKYASPPLNVPVTILICYETNGASWRLSVTDNGAGGQVDGVGPVKTGLGTSLVKALADQLDAEITAKAGPCGMSVSVIHTTIVPCFQNADNSPLLLP